MSKARSYFNDLPSISRAPSRTAPSSSARQRAPFKPPRPTGEAPSKGTMASTSGVQKKAPAKKADKGKTSAKAAGWSKPTKSAPKRAPAKTTIISSDNSDSEADDEPDNGKATGGRASLSQDSVDNSNSEPVAGRSRDRISTASASSDDEEMDTSLTSRRASTNRNATAGATASKQMGAVDEGPPPIPQKLLTRLLYEGFEDKDMKIGREAMNVYGKYIETFVREALARAMYEKEDADKDGGVGDGFVQVEDLERITPQLVLDF